MMMVIVIFREMIVFNRGDPIYHSKMLSFFRKENFDLEAVYANPVPSIHVPQIGKDKKKVLKIFLANLLPPKKCNDVHLCIQF